VPWWYRVPYRAVCNQLILKLYVSIASIASIIWGVGKDIEIHHTHTCVWGGGGEIVSIDACGLTNTVLTTVESAAYAPCIDACTIPKSASFPGRFPQATTGFIGFYPPSRAPPTTTQHQHQARWRTNGGRCLKRLGMRVSSTVHNSPTHFSAPMSHLWPPQPPRLDG
jgi:hypothetical protein